MARPAGRTLLIVSYLASLLLLFEGGARGFLSVDALRERAMGSDDASFRLQWVRRRSVEPSIYYVFDEHHPVRGWALKPNLRDLRVFGNRILNSNSQGVRGRREYARPKPRGLVRILIFGDSFTFGDEVGDDETYAAYLQALLPATEVVNLGVHGYGHDQMLLHLREVGARYEPDIVILGFVSDDMGRNLLGFRDFAKPRFVLRDDRLELTGVPVPTPDDVLAREPWRSKFFDLLTILESRWRIRTRRFEQEMERLTTAILDEFERTVREMGARPTYVYLPVQDEISAPDTAMSSQERYFFQYCSRKGIQPMYLRPYFLPKLRAGVKLKVYGHWGPLEHRTAAEGIRAYLVDKGMLPVEGPGPRSLGTLSIARTLSQDA